MSRFEDNLNNPHRGHEKFMNYVFDESEFVRKVDEAANLVKLHSVFRNSESDAENSVLSDSRYIEKNNEYREEVSDKFGDEL